MKLIILSFLLFITSLTFAQNDSITWGDTKEKVSSIQTGQELGGEEEMLLYQIEAEGFMALLAYRFNEDGLFNRTVFYDLSNSGGLYNESYEKILSQLVEKYGESYEDFNWKDETHKSTPELWNKALLENHYNRVNIWQHEDEFISFVQMMTEDGVMTILAIEQPEE